MLLPDKIQVITAWLLVALLLSAGIVSAQETPPSRVEIIATETGHALHVNGMPFEIKGAGLEFGDISLLAAHGGNAIRNWTTENAQQVLDTAYRHGVMVALCLPVIPERWGFDYSDEAAVARQLESMRQEVLKYRDHPALLAWIIGNELNFDYTNPDVYKAVNDISLMIHEVDPNHPTTTTVAGLGMNVVEDLESLAPDLDILSFQVYGELLNVPEFLQETDFERPVWITEWGAIGHWEMPKTAWQAPIELNSSEKARYYQQGFEQIIAPLEGKIIGSFAFLWGQKQERTPTWFGMFTEDGSETETIDVMEKIWTGEWPDNRSPAMLAMHVDGRTARDDIVVAPGQQMLAETLVRDPEGDRLTYRWELLPESNATEVGGDRERTLESLEIDFEVDTPGRVIIRAPETIGPYRLYVYAYDGHNHVAHANIPFLVNDQEAQER